MPWVVGIDEAGYGPNLGPLVQAAVALYLPDEDPAGWETLRPVVRRAHEKKDGRLLIDDSKKVYTRGGLAALEAVGYGLFGTVPQTVESFLTGYLCPECITDLRGEVWFDPAEQLPLAVPPADLLEACGQWTACYRSGFHGLLVNLVPAPLFNKVCDGSGSKGTVLSCGLVSLLAQVPKVGHGTNGEYADHPVTVLCDKLGGRNHYAALVQQAFPDGWVVAEKESADESRYRVERLGRPVTVTFTPRADAGSVAVALASMLAKYLREVCMRQFNRFWATHVPGIAPTAGYPTDAKRFYDQIRDAMAKLGLSEDQVWRKR
jgi:ribonuclease HII